MAPPRRPAARAPQTSGGAVNFGDDSFYLGGLGLPEGDYAMGFHTQMFQPMKQNGTPVGAAFLAVMMTAYPIDRDGNPIPGAEATEHPLGCGAKTHESFIPSADGKGFDTVAGGSGIGMNENCNWSLFRKSLLNSGLPPGTLTNDLGVIDGVWVHTRNIPEPEERKAFRKTKSATGEAALQAQNAAAEPERNRMCVTVVEILEGGKPWEGTGGLPGEAPAPAAKTAARPAAAATRAAAPAAAARRAPAAAADEVSEEDLKAAAINGIGEVLAKEPNGCFRVKLRTGTFESISKVHGDDMANAVLATYFEDDGSLNALLGEVGYVVAGARIAVAS